MNRNKIKTYAQQARRDLIRAVTDRAALFGVTKDKIEPVVEKKDVVVICGRPYPRTVAAQRTWLEYRIEHEGFEPTMEAIAYTWFNRLLAIRYMELHGYLDHGFRVLSHPEGRTTPEILEHAEEVSLPWLWIEKAIDLKLAGNKEPELYRRLLFAQCMALHDAMPFLFERIDDETELLLPDNLLQTDSIVRKLVAGIDEDDWQEVEIIGWLYEAYISERYEQVIGKVVASADIPAATQRFTPKWIVRYLVQNTLGRQWLATYPQSPLKGQMKYYIEPAEQTPEVQEQLRAITPTSLNPEEITFLDPACGSGHILVEAYDVFKAIYQERGYRARDIPRLILTKNLFGLEIDDRAAQLAAFALMMKARADDRRIFEHHVRPNVRSFIETAGMDAEDIAAALNVTDTKEAAPEGQLFETEDNLFTRAATTQARKPYISLTDVQALVDLFEHAKTFGSLIQVPPTLAERLPLIERRCREVAGRRDDIAGSGTAARFLTIVEQAQRLAGRHDCVVANPPYMGNKYYDSSLKEFIGRNYKDARTDLYACFIQRNTQLAKPNGFIGMITIANWMFLSSFESQRRSLLNSQTIETLNHNGRGIFGTDFLSCTFILRNSKIDAYAAKYYKLFEKGTVVSSNEELENRFLNPPETYSVSIEDIKKVPGEPIAFALSHTIREAFASHPSVGSKSSVRQGIATADDARFLRLWHEIATSRCGKGFLSRVDARTSGKKWFPLVKGGTYRKWYGNHDYVINWEDDGREIRSFTDDSGRLRSRPQNLDWFFKPGITYSNVSMHLPSFRTLEPGFVFSHVGQAIFTEPGLTPHLLGFMNSAVARVLLTVLSPSTHFEVGHVSALPLADAEAETGKIVEQLVNLAKSDWDSFEGSWDFPSLPAVQKKARVISESQEAADADCLERLSLAKRLEEENNRLFIKAYGLQSELSPEVPEDQITLYRPNREEDIKRLISYAVGCMMGRYSLDEPGLIYAHSSNVGFDPARYKTFEADPDGIVPVTEMPWFADDATNRFAEFVGVAWPRETLEENLTFVAESLGPGKGEAPRDTIRRYLATGFFKHHLQTYKRRPIYWLFSSGKQRAFQCLVYLHRYHEGTLSRMRTEYVIPLQGMIAARIEHLAGDITAATSTAQRKKLEKERETLLKQQVELHAFDEKLRHLADQRITLDLDDGVKVNYGKFGDLLAEVKAVTGGKEDD